MAVQPCCEVLLNFQPDPPEPETDLLEGPTELRDPGAELVELWELAKIPAEMCSFVAGPQEVGLIFAAGPPP